MDTVDKLFALAAFTFIGLCGYAVYADSSLRHKELELKYMAASAGAPLAVCVK